MQGPDRVPVASATVFITLPSVPIETASPIATAAPASNRTTTPYPVLLDAGSSSAGLVPPSFTTLASATATSPAGLKLPVETAPVVSNVLEPILMFPKLEVIDPRPMLQLLSHWQQSL